MGSPSLRMPFITVGEDMVREWSSGSHYVHSQDAERHKYHCPAAIFLFIQSKTPPHGMGPPTLKVGPQLDLSEIPPQIRPEVCLLGNSKSSQTDNKDSPTHAPKGQRKTNDWNIGEDKNSAEPKKELLGLEWLRSGINYLKILLRLQLPWLLDSLVTGLQG